MLSFLLFSQLSLAASPGAVVIVSLGPEGATLVDATFGGSPPQHRLPTTGERVEVLDARGRVLATAPIPDTRTRTVLGPDGVGEGAALLFSGAAVYVDWPEGAVTVALGEQRLAVHPRPPSTPVAVQSSGPDDERLDLVFLGDGYTADELDDFAADVTGMVAHLARIEPFGAYTGLFNVWRVDRASNESGGTHLEANPVIERDTAYGCYYGCGGIDRLICCDDTRVLAEVSESVPTADGVVVFINDPVYGGAGGWQYATSYNGPDYGNMVAAHELGHSLVGLWDEYSYGTTNNGDQGPNCAANAADPPWTAWADEPGIGAYPTCAYTNLFRPTDTACMMNVLQDAYCPVCREQAVLAIYGHLPGIIAGVEPAEGEVVGVEGTSLVFSASLLGPDDGSLVASWTLDGAELGTGPELTLPGCGAAGTLTFSVSDPTPWVRSDPGGLLHDSASWTLTRVPCVLPDSGGLDSGVEGGDKGRCGCASGADGVGAGAILALLVAMRRVRRLE